MSNACFTLLKCHLTQSCMIHWAHWVKSLWLSKTTRAISDLCWTMCDTILPRSGHPRGRNLNCDGGAISAKHGPLWEKLKKPTTAVALVAVCHTVCSFHCISASLEPPGKSILHDMDPYLITVVSIVQWSIPFNMIKLLLWCDQTIIIIWSNLHLLYDQTIIIIWSNLHYYIIKISLLYGGKTHSEILQSYWTICIMWLDDIALCLRSCKQYRSNCILHCKCLVDFCALERVFTKDIGAIEIWLID